MVAKLRDGALTSSVDVADAQYYREQIAREQRTNKAGLTDLEQELLVRTNDLELGADTPRSRRGRKAADLAVELDEMRAEDADVSGWVPHWAHEASHAVVAVLRGRRLQWVSRSATACEPADDVVACAGGVGERLARRDVRGSGRSLSDEQMALEALRARGKSAAWLPGAEATAADLLASHWPLVRAVATELDRFGTLSGQEVQAIMLRAAAAERAQEAEQEVYALLRSQGRL